MKSKIGTTATSQFVEDYPTREEILATRSGKVTWDRKGIQSIDRLTE